MADKPIVEDVLDYELKKAKELEERLRGSVKQLDKKIQEWKESDDVGLAKIDRAISLWFEVKDLKQRLALPRHSLRRILASMTIEERHAFYKRVRI